jgi:methionyl-tRNA formyltransferase
MKKLLIAGFGQPLIDLYLGLKHQFDVIGVIPDYHRRQQFPSFYEFLEKENIPILSFDMVANNQPDAVIVINYNKIINCSQVPDCYLLNIHMGLLPVYRGNNANSLAILNGEKKVGYTLHQVSDILDGGDIFYKFEYEIKEEETYYHAKKAINFDLLNVLPKVLAEILEGKISPVSQEGAEFIYAGKLYPEDGALCNWEFETDEIINRFKIFARPLGTGLKMRFRDNFLEISKISRIKNFKKSKGFPGAIVLTNANGSIWVKTLDAAISIDELLIDGKPVLPITLFKIGERL